MHYLVRLIVGADNETEANSQAKGILEKLVKCGELNWYQDEIDDERWPDCWAPIQLNSKKAQALVQETMQNQRTVFDELMATIRFMMSHYQDEQIFNEEFEQIPGMYPSRHQFTKAGGQSADACRLYSTTGRTIANQRELDYYLKNSKGLWVVQVYCRH